MLNTNCLRNAPMTRFHRGGRIFSGPTHYSRAFREIMITGAGNSSCVFRMHPLLILLGCLAASTSAQTSGFDVAARGNAGGQRIVNGYDSTNLNSGILLLSAAPAYQRPFVNGWYSRASGEISTGLFQNAYRDMSIDAAIAGGREWDANTGETGFSSGWYSQPNAFDPGNPMDYSLTSFFAKYVRNGKLTLTGTYHLDLLNEIGARRADIRNSFGFKAKWNVITVLIPSLKTGFSLNNSSSKTESYAEVSTAPGATLKAGEKNLVLGFAQVSWCRYGFADMQPGNSQALGKVAASQKHQPLFNTTHGMHASFLLIMASYSREINDHFQAEASYEGSWQFPQRNSPSELHRIYLGIAWNLQAL
jgi:hypothetical protein